MEGRGQGRARKISIGARPRSGAKQRKPARRQYTPTSNAVVFPNSSKHGQPAHSSTNFPLFSENACVINPNITQTAKLNEVSNKHRQSVTHLVVQDARKKDDSSPTPVEETVSFRQRRHMTLRSDASKRSGNSQPTDITATSTGGYVSPGFSCFSGLSSPYTNSDDIFPFQYLPDDCKLKVFSFLSSHDKGRCAQV